MAKRTANSLNLDDLRIDFKETGCSIFQKGHFLFMAPQSATLGNLYLSIQFAINNLLNPHKSGVLGVL